MKSPKLIAASLLGLMLFSMMACRDRSAKITSFAASPTSFTSGESAQLCYELVNAVNARIDPTLGELNDKNKSCLKVEPRQTTNYTLYATGGDGKTVSTQLTVNVEAAPLAKIGMFEAKQDGKATAPGSPAQLCYEVSGASSLSIKPDIGNVEPIDKGCRTVKPNRTTIYELAATGTDNKTVTKQATISVAQPAARIVRFDLSPANIKAGEKVHICYQVENAARAHIENVNYAVKLGPSECIDVQPRRSSIFTLEASNLDGQSVSQEARVTVEQPPVEIVDFRQQSVEVEKGNETVLHYKVSNAAKTQITYDGGAVSLTNAEGDQRIRPLRTTTYTLIAQDLDGKASSKSIVVKVVPPAQARILKFDPPTQTIAQGNEAKLCYGVTIGSKLSIYSELLKTSRDLESSEDKCINVRPTSTDTYTLTATGPNGAPVTSQARVSVTVPSPSAAFYAQSKTQRNTTIRIGRGDPVQLCYKLDNVAEVHINPGFGSIQVSQNNCLNLGELATTTVYTLSAKGKDGTTKTLQVTVQVAPPPQIVRFDGQTSSGRNFLCYEFLNGIRAEISPQIGELRNQRGCVQLPSPPSPSYTLTVYGNGKVPPAVSRFPRR